MEPYRHIVQYYETDRMGVTHHSNYVRWMEEARVDFLRQIGWGYERLEEAGIVSPVVTVDCKYLAPTAFPDAVTVSVTVAEFRGAVLKLRYEMFGREGRKVFGGHSEHCFLGKDGRLIRLKSTLPELYNLLLSLIPAE